MMSFHDAILSILEYKCPDNSATAAQIAEIGNWSKEEVEEALYKLSNNHIIDCYDLVEVVKTHPPTSPSIYRLASVIAIPEEELEAYLEKRNA